LDENNMSNYIVTQGEFGVLAGGSSLSIGTFGASPCVILGLFDGDACLLIHVHAGNYLGTVWGAVEGFKNGSARKPHIKAIISTETNNAYDFLQKDTLNYIMTALDNSNIRDGNVEEYGASAGFITKDGFEPMSDKQFVERADSGAIDTASLRAMATDENLRKGGVKLNPVVSPN
jgi:hypothetical protein